MRYFVLVLFAILLLTACRDDFSLEAPYRDVPVVFAYLNDAEGEHFIRVQKAFLGQNGNAELAATNQDSLYYSAAAAQVTLTQGNGTPITLSRVNGDDYGILRPEGSFVNSPNILYRFTDSELNLLPNQALTLRISRPGWEDAVATTRTLGAIEIVQPSNTAIVIENYRQFQNWRWNTSSSAARVFDARLFITIREFSLNDPSQNRDRILEWVIDDRLIPEAGESRVVLQFRNELFWQFLGANLEEDPNVYRFVGNMELRITAVGAEVEEQLALARANAGITSAQTLPLYTNVENGLGIFTARSTVSLPGIALDGRNLDTLRNGIYTRNLNFQ